MLRRAGGPRVVDIAIALGFLAAVWATSGAAATTDPSFTYTPRDGLFVLLVLGATLPYAVRRRWPTAAFLVSLASTTTLWALGYDGGTLPLVMLVGGFWVAAARPVREVAVSGIAALLCFGLLLVADGAPFGMVEWTASVVSLAGAFALGRSGLLRAELAEARAQTAEEATLRRAREERLQVSRELHDIVGHTLGVIAVQAGVGRHLMDTQPERAAEALDAIAEVSRDALDEVRAVLGALRDGDPDLRPTPGLADLGELVEATRSPELTVALTLPDDPEAVPRQAAASAYGIVREALTNVVRHAQATRVEVTIGHRDGRVSVRVRDDGRGAPEPGMGAGHGIRGMRERAEAVGGTLSVQSAPGRGFEVLGTLPAAGGVR